MDWFRFALAVLLLSQCAGAEKVAPPGEQILNFGNGAEPKDLDPHVGANEPEFNIEQNIFEGLVGKNPETLALVPGVAERWVITDAGKTYTFFLRKDAKWSNGEPVTADDFVYSWRRLVDPKTASEYASQGNWLKNGKLIGQGKIRDLTQLGVRAKDPHTLVATLERPTPFFLATTYMSVMYPLPRKAIEKFGARWTRPENMVSNGPFLLEKWDVNKSIRLKKNPFYWDRENVRLTQVNIIPTENANTEENMFRTKQLDVTLRVPQDKIPLWTKDRTGVFYSSPILATYCYRVNVTKPPLNDKRVRRALALGLDRSKIVKYVTQGGQSPARNWTPPGIKGFNPIPRFPSDLSQLGEAKQLLREAGFPDGKGLPPIEILYNTDEGHKKIAEAVQQMWKINLGVKITMQNQEWKVFLNSERMLEYQLARFTWNADYNDPNTFLELWMTENQNNQTGYSNLAYDHVLEAAANELDLEKRKAIFQKAEDIIGDEVPIIPIYTYTHSYLKAKKVQGWTSNIENFRPLKYVWISVP
jgi:oligopeptide transport system substrate-binding protein